jgi:hypothetical protein
MKFGIGMMDGREGGYDMIHLVMGKWEGVHR